MKKSTLARQTAELIAHELFSYGPLKIDRLVLQLRGEPGLSGPGWCERHVADKIYDILNRKHVIAKKALVKK